MKSDIGGLKKHKENFSFIYLDLDYFTCRPEKKMQVLISNIYVNEIIHSRDALWHPSATHKSLMLSIATNLLNVWQDNKL